MSGLDFPLTSKALVQTLTRIPDVDFYNPESLISHDILFSLRRHWQGVESRFSCTEVFIYWKLIATSSEILRGLSIMVPTIVRPNTLEPASRACPYRLYTNAWCTMGGMDCGKLGYVWRSKRLHEASFKALTQNLWEPNTISMGLQVPTATE